MVDVKELESGRFLKRLRLVVRDQRGQDLIEYALLAAFMVVAVAAVLPNDLMPAVSGIFSKVLVHLNVLGGG